MAGVAGDLSQFMTLSLDAALPIPTVGSFSVAPGILLNIGRNWQLGASTSASIGGLYGFSFGGLSFGLSIPVGRKSYIALSSNSFATAGVLIALGF